MLQVRTGRSASHGSNDSAPCPAPPGPARPGPAPPGPLQPAPYANASATDATNASTMPIHCCAVNRSRSTTPASTTVPIG